MYCSTTGIKMSISPLIRPTLTTKLFHPGCSEGPVILDCQSMCPSFDIHHGLLVYTGAHVKQLLHPVSLSPCHLVVFPMSIRHLLVQK